MVFCKKQYRKLLKYSQQLEKAGKKLFDICKSDYDELLRYSAKTDAQLEWESRDSYAELMDHFLNGKISEGRLQTKFLEIQESHEQVQQVLESNLGSKSTAVASNKVLIKGDEGRYLIEVSGNQVNVLGICARGNKKNIKSFERLMNKMYDINLQY